MPLYTYRREDGTTFDYRQKFLDEPLKVDPETGQQVVRVVQATSIIFKGSGFYVNDSKKSSSTSVTPSKPKESESSSTEGAKTESTTPAATTETKSEAKETPKTETKPAAQPAAAD